MNTTIAITLIVAALVLGLTIVTAARDVAQAKHNATHCPNCGHTSKENQA